MIEKLDYLNQYHKKMGRFADAKEKDAFLIVFEKINELIDFVNTEPEIEPTQEVTANGN